MSKIEEHLQHIENALRFLVKSQFSVRAYYDPKMYPNGEDKRMYDEDERRVNETVDRIMTTGDQ